METNFCAKNSLVSTLTVIKNYFKLREETGHVCKINIHREYTNVLEFFHIPEENIILYGKEKNIPKGISDQQKKIITKAVFSLFNNLLISKEESPLLKGTSPKKRQTQSFQCIGCDDEYGEPMFGEVNIVRKHWNTHQLKV